MPKNPPYFLPDHATQIAQNKKNPLKIKDSYYFPTYPVLILSNIILLNHNLTILLPKVSYNGRLFLHIINFLPISHRTIHRVHFYPFPNKKEAIAETMTSNLFHYRYNAPPDFFIQPTANHSSSHIFSHAFASYHSQSHLLNSDMIHILSPIWQLPLPLSEY